MNAIMDLTARAVSFITMIQSALLKGAIAEKNASERISILTISPAALGEKLRLYDNLENKNKTNNKNNKEIKEDEDSFYSRALELIWISANPPEREKLTAYAIKVCVSLADWIREKEKEEDKHNKKSKHKRFTELLKEYSLFPTPYNWREAISDVLYENKDERVSLATALQYMPLQIVLALGGGVSDARSQMILQLWTTTETGDRDLLLNKKEVHIQSKLAGWEEMGVNATTLLKNDDLLYDHLKKKQVPFSFEIVFKTELHEISRNRVRRTNEENLSTGGLPEQDQEIIINDPFKAGRSMHLYALAFSGGGIRSATFNLGILEGLAQKNLLSKFDYLSAVSGGGYISSWLAAWVKRDGSMLKVSNRLCPDKSPDPLGEEVKPIKWLRMFSNYFAPNASIMSADAWTVGMTWLRNTLLNQLIIFLLLLSVMFFGNFFYTIWPVHPKSGPPHYFLHDINAYKWLVVKWSCYLLIPVSILTGMGMHAYNSNSYRWIRWRKILTDNMSLLIIALAFVGAYLASAWLSSTYYIPPDSANAALVSFSDKVSMLWPAAVVALACLLLVAWIGNYVQLIKNYKRNAFKTLENNLFSALFIIGSTALIAAAAGLVAVSGVAMLLESFIDHKFYYATDKFVTIYANELRFIFGVPLIIEIFSLMVVLRMALLGKYFPDERREWWGRMGAYVHRLAFLWLLISASFLTGQKFIFYLFKHKFTAIAATGGWATLVGAAVKAAFSSQTSGKDNKKGTFSIVLDVLGKAGPYLFALGLLIFLPGLIEPIMEFTKAAICKIAGFFQLDLPHGTWHNMSTEAWLNILIFALTAITVTILSWQIGVNEFSMHYFYRNRLVRAYLGATRRSADRQQTSNPFTGFDKKDDEKLADLQHKSGYHGPYLILNTALNASQEMDLDRQDRKAESFIFSPLFCGFDFSMVRSTAEVKTKSYDYAYRKTDEYADRDGGPSIGMAMATSGAAVNPNQGYHSSAATAFLLTVFNVQLGRWIGNPRKAYWTKADPGLGLAYIFDNLIGKTSTKDRFVALSDGGHFDNMGLYEMVRRKCKFIILCDAEQDDTFTCEGFANAIRRCRIDFGAEIDIKVNEIIERTEGRFSTAHFVKGTIKYAGDKDPYGRILYIKSSITKEVPVDIREYAMKNITFPHQTTADQFFDEEQFESYRRLGLYIADLAFNVENTDVREHLGFD